jgi:O-antigen/teichoic acid export membrane protein
MNEASGRYEHKSVRAAEEVGDAHTLATGASVNLGGAVVARALNMANQILMARFLGAASFGLYAIGWTMIRVLGGIGTLGLEAGVIYFGANYQRQPRKFKGAVIQSLTIPFLSGAVLTAAVWLIAPALAHQVFHKPDASRVIRLFAFAFPFYTVCFVAGGITKLSQCMQYSVYASLAQAGAALLLFSILFALGWGLAGAIIATLSGIVVGASLSLCYVTRLFPVVRAKHVHARWVGRELLTYSGSVMLAGVGYNGLMFIDRFFVAAFRSASETGIYQAASQLSILFAILLGAFHGVFRPMVADIYARGDDKRLAELYRVCTKWTLYACLPLFLVVVSFPAQLVEFVYGNAYGPAAIPLVILSLSQLVMVVTAGSHTMLVMTGRQRIFVVAALSCLVGDLLLNWVLVPEFGLSGAASAMAISNVTLNVITVVAVRKHLGLWPVDGRLVKGCIATVVTFGALLMTKMLGIDTPLLNLLLVGCVSVVVFAGCVVAVGVDPEDMEVLRLVRDRIVLSRLWALTAG